MRIFYTIALIFLSFVSACSAPGTPPTVSKASGLSSSQLACQLVSPSAKQPPFITEYYLTTYKSALAEGARSGLREGLIETGLQPIERELRQNEFILGNSLFVRNSKQAKPFCMVFRHSKKSVLSALSKTLNSLRASGYGVSKKNFSNGFYKTTLVPRAHRSADWYDRFIVSTASIDDSIVVYVFREGYISRGSFEYFQGFSVGNNEAWILGQIRRFLN